MPSDLKRRKFCSKACVGLSRKNVRKKQWAQMTCRECGVSFEVPLAWVKNGRRQYCTKKCRTKARPPKSRTGQVHTPAARQAMSEKATGRYAMERSSQWKGGRFRTRDKYWSVMIATLPVDAQALARQMLGGKYKYILEHRIVAAMTLKRPILQSEVVHHINGDKGDNRPENLEVVPRAAHSVHHRDIERRLASVMTENERLREENRSLRLRLGLSPTDG